MGLSPLSEDPGRQPVSSMQASYPSRQRSPAGFLWGLQMWLEKKRIEWEDRLGLFGYPDWIRTVERRQQIEIRRQAEQLQDLSISFCFLIAGMGLTVAALAKTFQSLQAVRAPWVIAVLLPADWPAAQTLLLREWAARNPAVLLVPLTAGPAASGNWLPLLPDLPGDWIIPLRAGDQLSPSWWDAFRVYQNQAPQSALFFWDEDVWALSGRRIRPFFKPGWSPELLYVCSYLESAAYHRDILNAALNQMSAGAEGWVFEAAALAPEPRRIPLVLQHRAPLSEMDAGELRKRAAAGAAAALSRRSCLEARVDFLDHPSCLRAIWKTQKALVSIIIPTKNNLEYIRRCLSTLIDRTQGIAYEVILMDDHSNDPAVLAYYEEVKARCPQVRIYANEGPFNYSRVNNQGAAYARGDLLLFLNNDVEVLDSEWLEEMVRWSQLPDVGMVGARLVYPDGAIQHAGVIVGMTGHAGHIFAGPRPHTPGPFLPPDCTRNVSAVTGACMLVRRDAFEQVGGFNEELILVFNDIELGARFINRGWRIVYAPNATLIHYEGRSRSRYMPPRDIRLGAEALAAEIEQGDRWYHPNLSRSVNWPTFRRRYETNDMFRLRQIVRFKGSLPEAHSSNAGGNPHTGD